MKGWEHMRICLLENENDSEIHFSKIECYFKLELFFICVFVNCSQLKWGPLPRRCKPIKRSTGSAISAASCGSLNSLLSFCPKAHSQRSDPSRLWVKPEDVDDSGRQEKKISYMPCALCPVGGDVAKRLEYSNWRKLRVAWSKTMNGPRITKEAARCGYGVSQPVVLGPRRWWRNGLEGHGGDFCGHNWEKAPHSHPTQNQRGELNYSVVKAVGCWIDYSILFKFGNMWHAEAGCLLSASCLWLLPHECSRASRLKRKSPPGGSRSALFDAQWWAGEIALVWTFDL